jgi:RNA polymerase sigma factor (sigma-70 family)
MEAMMLSSETRVQLDGFLDEARTTTGKVREEALGHALLLASKRAFGRALACVEDWLDGTRDDAEDALQAVRLKACRRLKHFVVKTAEAFMDWFLNILDHYLIDRQRRRNAKGWRRTKAESDPEAAGVLDLITSREPGPELAAQRAEDVAAVRRALRRLSTSDREIVLARKDDVSIDQIALSTGCTRRHMRSHIDMLFEHLRADLGASADAGNDYVKRSPKRLALATCG